MLYDVIVLGMGASGLFALANIARSFNALGIESNRKAGVKLAITGGGRCNLTNTDEIKKLTASYTHPSFARPILHAFNNFKTMEYFESRGLHLKDEGGRIYPKSETAKDVTEFFLQLIEKKGHKIYYEEEILTLEFESDRVILRSGKNSYECKKLILACGGASYPQTGSTGKLLSRCFDIQPFEAGLSSMEIEENCYRSLQGISLDVSLKYKKKFFRGNLLFAGARLTGPVIMDLSNEIVIGEEFIVDFLPERSREELKGVLERELAAHPKRFLRSIVAELCQLPLSFLNTVLSASSLSEKRAAELQSKELNLLISELKEKSVSVRSKLPLEQAIVSKGGIKCSEIDNKTMCLKDEPKIAVIGEAIELVGACGGYNLQFAFSSAHRAVKPFMEG